MGESVDVKALTARFRQGGIMAAGGGGPPRLPPPILERGVHSPVDSGANGGVRPRLPAPLNKPASGPFCPSNGPRFGPAPRGVFPRPPPSYRSNHQEPVRPPFAEPDVPGPFRSPGEKPAKPLPKPQCSPVGRHAQTFQTPPLHMQRSVSSEVPPLLRPLPAVGPKPNKPSRPPFVNLEPFRKSPGTPKPSARLSERTSEGSNSPTVSRPAGVMRPPLLPNRPRNLTQSVSKQDMDDEQDTYDDIAGLPPPPPSPPTQRKGGFGPPSPRAAAVSTPPSLPSKSGSMTKCPSDPDLDDDQDTYDDIESFPPPPPTQSQDSWIEQNSSQTEWDDSDESEIYEEVETESQENIPVLTETSRQTTKDMKKGNSKQEKKEQKERQKRESADRKNFKLTGNETALHIARIREDWQGGKHDLCVRQGDSVEIMRTENNPGGRWLARTMDGRYGYISTQCVDMDYEEVKRRFGSLAKPRHDPGLYDDVDRNTESCGCDDDKFPPPPPEISPDPKTLKKMEKEEKEFRKKFKFEGPIKVLEFMKVDPMANIKKGGGKDLNVFRGETLEVIQFTNDKKALCRNVQGKYGYVPLAFLQQEEGEIYDDVDHQGDVYDNDKIMIK